MEEVAGGGEGDWEEKEEEEEELLEGDEEGEHLEKRNLLAGEFVKMICKVVTRRHMNTLEWKLFHVDVI